MSKRVEMLFDENLIDEVDKAAKEQKLNRTALVEMVLENYVMTYRHLQAEKVLKIPLEKIGNQLNTLTLATNQQTKSMDQVSESLNQLTAAVLDLQLKIESKEEREHGLFETQKTDKTIHYFHSCNVSCVGHESGNNS